MSALPSRRQVSLFLVKRGPANSAAEVKARFPRGVVDCKLPCKENSLISSHFGDVYTFSARAFFFSGYNSVYFVNTPEFFISGRPVLIHLRGNLGLIREKRRSTRG